MEKYPTQIAISRKAGLGCVAAFFGFTCIRFVEGARDVLPEPFDIVDHAGNMNHSVLYGALTALFAGRLYRRYAERNGATANPMAMRGIMYTGAAAVGLMANIVAETKIGAGLGFGRLFTPDTVDIVYGTIAATAMGALPSIRQKTDRQ